MAQTRYTLWLFTNDHKDVLIQMRVSVNQGWNIGGYDINLEGDRPQ